jgi:hypothetical protein
MVDAHDVLYNRAISTPEQPLYYKNDSHWNKLGAYYYFQAIVDKFKKLFHEEEFKTEFAFVENETGVGGNTGKGGDLTYILMLPELTETYPQVKKIKHCAKMVRLLTYRPLGACRFHKKTYLIPLN